MICLHFPCSSRQFDKFFDQKSARIYETFRNSFQPIKTYHRSVWTLMKWRYAPPRICYRQTFYRWEKEPTLASFQIWLSKVFQPILGSKMRRLHSSPVRSPRYWLSSIFHPFHHIPESLVLPISTVFSDRHSNIESCHECLNVEVWLVGTLVSSLYRSPPLTVASRS